MSARVKDVGRLPSTGVPGGLPKGWRRVAIKDMADSIQYGHTASAIQRKYGPRFLRITDIQDGRVDWNAVPSCDIPKDDVPKYRLAPGDLVFARTGATTGKSFLIGDCPEAVFASYLIRVRVSADVDSRYLATFFQSPDYWQQIEGGKRGIGQPNVNGQVLGQVQFPLAPPKEQRRIVAEIEKQFTRLEAGVAALRRVQANLKRYRAAVLKAACEGKLVPTEAELVGRVPPRGVGRAKTKGNAASGDAAYNDAPFESGEQLLQRILAERRQRWTGRGQYKEPAAPDTANLPPLPAGWTWATVEQLGRIETGSTPPKAEAANYGDEVPLVKPGELLDHPVAEAADNLTGQGASVATTAPADSILVSCIGNLGKTALTVCEVAFNQQINAIIPTLTATARWIFYSVQQGAFRRQLEAVASATTISIVNKSKFSALLVSLPPHAEQTRIVAEVERRLSVVEELETVVSANLLRATRLRQSILQKAFTGEL